MTGDRAFDAPDYLDAVSPVLGLTITPAQRPGVIRFLQVAHGMAAILDKTPLDRDAVEPAPVFSAGTHGTDPA